MIFLRKIFFKYNCFVCTDCKSALSGLEGTTPYDNNDLATRKLTPEDKIRIGKILEAESSNQPQYNQSGILTYFPQGTPCN